MKTELELHKLTEECGELIQICMKVLTWGKDSYSPKNEAYNTELMIEEMGDVLCHLKRTTNALNLSWDSIQKRSLVKNEKVNKYHYGEEKEWEIK